MAVATTGWGALQAQVRSTDLTPASWGPGPSWRARTAVVQSAVSGLWMIMEFNYHGEGLGLGGWADLSANPTTAFQKLPYELVTPHEPLPPH